MSLYLKYRPTSFDQIQGNEEVISSLQRMVSSKECVHSFLFIGPTGCGKTTLARIVAQELGVKGSDFRELDSAQYRGIDDIRAMRKQMQYHALEGTISVWLLDECHKLTGDAQNALLKILEDTPKHVYIILATTDPQKLIPTVRGRCSQFAVKPLNDSQMMNLLRKVVKAEGESLMKPVYEQLIQDGFGLPRNTLQILDQVLRVDEDERLIVAKRSAEEESQSIELCRALLSGAPWKKVANLLKGLKETEDPERIRRAVLGYAQAILLKTDNPRAALTLEMFIEPFYNSGYPGLVLASYSVVNPE